MTREPGQTGTDDAAPMSSTNKPNQPASDEADRSKETTPAGIEADLEDKAEELGATTRPSNLQEQPE